MRSSKKLILSALLCGLALALSLLDGAVSALLPMPGFKLGIANVVTLFAMIVLGNGYALLICISRSLLAALFSGNVTMLFFSLSGGLLSLFVMMIAVRRISLIKTSVLGGVFHNVAQLGCAFVLTGTPQIGWYFPVLAVTSIVCGFFVGVVTKLVLRRLKPTAAFSA